MKDEDLEKLSLDSFDEDEFMLNDMKREEVDSITSTSDEKDLTDEIEIMEEVMPLPKKEEVHMEVRKDKKNKKETRESRTKKKGKGFKIPSDKKGKKVYLVQAVFCGISALFILGCCIFYGSRLIKYYKIYNPKTEAGEVIQLIGSSILSSAEYTTEGEGIYRISGNSIYKGENVKNYIRFANQMWRIISVNVDGSLDITTDGYINALSFNDKATTFDKSDLNKYLNNVFLNTLNKDYLSTTSYCLDEVEDIVDITCNNVVSDNYVRLLGIAEFLNSKADTKTYLESSDGYWIYNTNSAGAWHTSGTSLSNSAVTEGYLVKPVVRIKNSTQLVGGTGTKEDPFLIEKENTNLEVGNYVKLGNDTWVIYELKDKTMNLALSTKLNTTYRFSNSGNKFDPSVSKSLAQYLNTTYLNSLSYKDKLNDNEWCNGSYNSNYENICKSKVTAKVGIYNIADLKINNTDETFYLMTPSDTNYVYLYNMGLNKSKVTLTRNIKPTININKYSVESGKGTLTDPYILGE